MLRELPMTEIEALRLLQAHNMVVQRNERLENVILELEIKAEAAELKIKQLSDENAQLRFERDIAINKYLKATSLIIDGEAICQAKE